MASLEAILSPAVVDSVEEPLDSQLSADSSSLCPLRPAVLQTRLTSGHPGEELLPLPWLSDEVLDVSIGPAGSKEDAFSGMEWMAEDIDLNEFDLDSLMGSCDSDESPSSPEELIASLESHMDLELAPLQFTTPTIASPLEGLAIPQPELPPLSPPPPLESQQELEIKSEPASPAPLPSPLPSASPAYTLELGSEVDVPDAPKIVLSLSPSQFVLLLAPKEEPAAASPSSSPGPSPASADDLSDSDSGIESVSGSSHHGSCSPAPPPRSGSSSSSRPKPYSILSKSKAAPASPASPGKIKSPSGAPVVVEKKLKKMEQNKTAATRYRQKKRVEQESLSSECGRLEQRNRELAEKADSISKEIQYLKDLIEEVRNAKNRKKGRPELP
ncbi:hypothetical protein AAFF_G00296190 [Aldrovandia affinis]|uniref:Cyclic AMP-dependent transcription factor ATF-4 n=1 Tax=Aldrovandia affinis TaxID=143900 RepID=A0AAD7SQC6_9TELE|nr:hypothetical protein AAFF_G00296190 [Aldrovandia affinis]